LNSENINLSILKTKRNIKKLIYFKYILVIILLYWSTDHSNSQNPWPGETWQNSVNLTYLASEFQNNLSGAHWNSLTRRLWVCVNGPGSFWAIKEDLSGGFIIDSTGGNPAKWSYNGDIESICQADYQDTSVFLLDESVGKILEFNVTTGQQTILLHTWNITPYIPAYNGYSGPEGITFVPDFWLKNNGFVDSTGQLYHSQNGMGGLMFVAHQNGGHVYAFDLNRSNDTCTYIGKYLTSHGESSGLEFDRSTGMLYIWHNTGSNYIEITDMTSIAVSELRKFVTQTEFYGPKTGNLEGIAITPTSSGENWYFATDDSNQDGYALMWFSQFIPGISVSLSVHLSAYLECSMTGTQMNTVLNDNHYLPLSQPYNGLPWDYSGTEMVSAIPDTSIVDWILVEFRDASEVTNASGTTRIYRQAAFLKKDGYVVSMDGSSDLSISGEVSNNLFTVLYHQNHVGIISANPLTGAEGIYMYDFTTGAGQAYNGGQKEIATGIWGMIAGDADASGLIDVTDKSTVWESQAGRTGYLGGDMDMNSQTDNRDKNDFWLPNLGEESQVPE